MDSFIIYVEHFANGCRLMALFDDQIHAVHIDLYNIKRRGEIYAGRIMGTSLSSPIVWVDIGDHKPALLKKRKKSFTVGQPLMVRITREAVEYKGPQVVLDSTLSLASTTQIPSLQQAVLPQWLAYLSSLSPDHTINVIINHESLFDQAQQHFLQQPHFFHFSLQRASPLPGVVEDHWQDLLQDRHPLKGGGHLIMTETPVATIIDINTSNMDDFYSQDILRSPADRLKFNQKAADQIIRWLYLRQCQGLVLIDFIKSDQPLFNQHLLAYIEQALCHDKDIQVYGFTKAGLVEIQYPYYGPSLLAKSNRLHAL